MCQSENYNDDLRTSSGHCEYFGKVFSMAMKVTLARSYKQSSSIHMGRTQSMTICSHLNVCKCLYIDASFYSLACIQHVKY